MIYPANLCTLPAAAYAAIQVDRLRWYRAWRWARGLRAGAISRPQIERELLALDPAEAADLRQRLNRIRQH